jgi:NADH-quinone oxidoreductase subunit L
MGGLRRKIPVTFFTFLIGVLAISGFPFTSGFVSKDEILLAAYYHNKMYFWLAVLGALLTAIYMFRVLLLTFAGSFRGTADQQHHLHESPPAMTIPLVLLALLSVAGGWVQLPHVFGGHDYFNQFLSASVPAQEHSDPGLATLEYILLGVTAAALLLIYILSSRSLTRGNPQGEYTGVKKFLANKWYVDELYERIITKPLHWLNKNVLDFIEKEIIDWMVDGVGKLVQLGGRQVRLLQTGQVGSYVLLMVISAVVFFVIQFLIKK